MLTARELSVLIREYCSIDGNLAGGNCHIVLEDTNIKDEHIHFCIKECITKNDKMGLFIMLTMLNMRKTARLKAIELSKKTAE